MTSPFHGPPFDGPPEEWPDRIVFVSGGSGPPRWHVRDQEALNGALPLCGVVVADRATLTPVGLRIHAATIWLPDAQLAEPMEEPPDERTEGWHWPSGDALYLQTGGRRDMPGLRSLVGHAPDEEHALLAGRPVSVHRYTELEEDGTECHRAVVGGFLDDVTTLHVDVSADSPEGRDRLLAVLLTLRPT